LVPVLFIRQLDMLRPMTLAEALSMRLKDKVVLITGASRGIGKQLAIRFAREGANLVLAARTVDTSSSPFPGTIHETADAVRAFGTKALAVRCDLALRADVEQLCRSAIEEFGRVDILINNAAYFGPGHYDAFMSLTLEQWETMIDVDLNAPVLACRLLLPGMIERKSGLIICMTSVAATHDVPLGGRGGISPGYPTAKAGLNRFVRALAAEIREHQIPVIAVEPGFTVTERTAIIFPRNNMDFSAAQSMEIPVRAVVELSTCEDPMAYTGQVIIAADFTRERGLV
jgi:NAD(P)-dependent dehydrogenase (short-subunit alcohol dehydrogenase family)